MMMSFWLLFSSSFFFHIFCCLAMSTSRGFRDLGAQSGNETQFLFFEGDVRQSDADDLIIRPAHG